MRHLADKTGYTAGQSTEGAHLKTLGFGIFHKAAGVDENTVHCFRVLRDPEAMPAQVS